MVISREAGCPELLACAVEPGQLRVTDNMTRRPIGQGAVPGDGEVRVYYIGIGLDPPATAIGLPVNSRRFESNGWAIRLPSRAKSR